MATKTVVYCDICGKENASPVRVYVDRRMDGAGSMEDIQERIDLCASHACEMLEFACRHDHERAKRVISEIGARGRNHKAPLGGVA